MILAIFAGFISSIALAQQPPLVSLGDAVVSGFSGTVVPAPDIRIPPGKTAADFTFINPEGPSARIVDLSRPGFVWDGRLFNAPKTFDIKAKDVGQVFGIALDDSSPPNIYVAATSAFGLNIVARTANGTLERRKKGSPGTSWMKGQFGLDLGGSPGAIYKIDGLTGKVSLFANVTLDGVPNPAAGLGNLAFDAEHKQLFVSDLYTGMIHRFDLRGNDLGRYDHGVTGLAAAKQPTVAFDPRWRPNIASAAFDSENPDTWGFAPAQRRVIGLAVHKGRLYYSVASGPQIWSVGITREGRFDNDPRWETDIPAQAGALPVTDIAFSQKGAMILAQRALIAASYDYTAFTRPGEPRVFRLWLKGPNDPPSPGRWKLEPEEYAVGFAGTHRNTNGGIALGYGYDRNGLINGNGCEFSLWTTGQNLRNAPTLRERLGLGGPLSVNGIFGVPASPVRTFNEPPWTSYAVDYDDRLTDGPKTAGHLGSVRIYSAPCAAPAAYYGPGYAADPPYVVTVVGGCIGRGCRPPPPPPPVCVGPSCAPVDISIKKDGATTPAQQPFYSFTMTITNNGGSFTGANNITVTDVLPAGMTFNTVTASPAGDWSCPASVPAGGTLTCTYIGSGPVPSGVIGTLTINATVSGTAPYPPVTNCATVGVSGGYTDTNPDNNKSCVTVTKEDKTGELIIVKKIVNQGPIPLPNLTYPVTVTCGTWSHSFNLVDNVPQSVGGVPLNTDCNAVETPPPPPSGLCPPSATPTWQPVSITPPNPFRLTGTTLTVTVTNTFECKPKGNETGELIIVKKLRIDNTSPVPNLTYPVTVTCGTWSHSFNLVDNVPQSVGGVPLNTDCNATETLPPPPNGYCPPSVQASWLTPSVAPSNPFQLTGTTLTVTVTNTLVCGPGPQQATGTLQVVKTVQNDTEANISGLTFAATATCGNASTALNLTTATPQTVTGLVAGTVCSVTETLPPPPATGCVTGLHPAWDLATVSPSTVTIAAGTTTTITVANKLRCERGGNITVKKNVINNTMADVSGLNFPVTVSCAGGSSPFQRNFTLTAGSTELLHNIPIGNTCTPSETLPAAPTNGCPAGQTPAWGPPVYTPTAVTSVAGAGPTLTVQNTLNCVPAAAIKPPPPDKKIACRAPLVANTKGDACVCRPGTALRNARCVVLVTCVAPAYRNQAGTACLCPQGMVNRGNSCVKRAPEPRVRTDDVIRVVPKLFPGSGRSKNPTRAD